MQPNENENDEDDLLYVESFDLTLEEKKKLIHDVDSIMESFVDQAFGLHPLQQRVRNLPPKDPKTRIDLIES